MTVHTRLDAALDRHPDAPGTVRVEPADGSEVEVDVVRVGPIGVRVDRVGVTHATPRPLAAEAARIAADVRPHGESLDIVEVDPALGGAVLRTRPRDMRRRQFTEVEITPTQTTVRRVGIADDGARTHTAIDVTRDQLADLVDGLIGQGQR